MWLVITILDIWFMGQHQSILESRTGWQLVGHVDTFSLHSQKNKQT